MQPRAAPRHRAVVVEDHDRSAVDLHRDQPQQNGPGPTTSTPRARAYGLWPYHVPGCRQAALDHVQSTLLVLRSPPNGHDGVPTGSPSVSGRMSIRQPVSLAARRAFWPSLPIASESW